MTGLGNFEAIVLAAGAGTRFGGGKLLAPYGPGLVLEGALQGVFAAPVLRVTVVTGADAARVAAAAQAYAERVGQGSRLSVIHAPDHSQGMGASLRCGAQTLAGDVEGVFVFLGDMPRIPHAVLEPLAQAIAQGAPAAATQFGGQRGHPAVIGASLIPQLLTLTGDAGARAVLQGLGDQLVLIEAPDDGVLFDIDRPGDLAAG